MLPSSIIRSTINFIRSNGATFEYKVQNGDAELLEKAVAEDKAGNFGAIVAELKDDNMVAVKKRYNDLAAAAILLLTYLKGGGTAAETNAEPEAVGDDSTVDLLNDKPFLPETSSPPDPKIVDDKDDNTDEEDTDVEREDDIFTGLPPQDGDSGSSMLGMDIDPSGDDSRESFFSILGSELPVVKHDFGIKLDHPNDDGLSLEDPISTEFQSHIQSIIEESDSLSKIQRDWTLIIGQAITGTMLLLTIIAWVIMGNHYAGTVKRQNELNAKVILNDTLIQTLRDKSTSEKDLLYYRQRDALFAERDKALTNMLNGVEYKANLILADNLLLELEKLRNEWIANK